MTNWVEVLEGYEQALDAHEALLGAPEVADQPLGWLAPEVPAGGIPVEHQGRARALLQRTEELARCAAMVRDSLPPLPANRPTRTNPYTTSTPRQVDRAI